jgi:hypothetical protein
MSFWEMFFVCVRVETHFVCVCVCISISSDTHTQNDGRKSCVSTFFSAILSFYLIFFADNEVSCEKMYCCERKFHFNELSTHDGLKVDE